MAILGKVEIIRPNGFIEIDDNILYEATSRTTLGESKTFDAFVLNNGIATHHFTGTV